MRYVQHLKGSARVQLGDLAATAGRHGAFGSFPGRLRVPKGFPFQADAEAANRQAAQACDHFFSEKAHIQRRKL